MNTREGEGAEADETMAPSPRDRGGRTEARGQSVTRGAYRAQDLECARNPNGKDDTHILAEGPLETVTRRGSREKGGSQWR